MRTISWSLTDLLRNWVQVSCMNTMIYGLSSDSRVTKAGDLFFAVPGLQKNGFEFCPQAVENGAAAIAWDADKMIKNDGLSSAIPCIPIAGLQQQVGFIAQRFYHHPSAHLNVIGVTGTDGKTSVSQFIAQAFNQLKISCGVIGTLGYGIYPDLKPATHTTPDAIRMQELLEFFADKQASSAVIEASSHGLKQGRLNGVAIDTAVFTNLGGDHLDYHLSLQDYGNSKRILFQMPGLKHAVINVDDEFGCLLANELEGKVNVVTYSCDHRPCPGHCIHAKKISSTRKVTKIEVGSSWGSATIKTNLYGEFNVSNILAAASVLLVSGCSFKDTIKAISSVRTALGRMELVSGVNNVPTVIVDYAHTSQALKNVLQVLRQRCAGRLWCVFGCGGDRDPGKRKLMAEVVEQSADYAVVTDDNPRSEDPVRIAKDILSGFSSSTSYSLIHDRRKAIEYAINNAAREDIVLVAGKGHETVQIINDERVSFNDKKTALACLQNYE